MNKSPEILLIDDDLEIALWLNKIKDHQDIPNTIKISQSYINAMELLFPSKSKGKHIYPKLILLEIPLSNNMGLSLLKSIKKHDELKKIPIIILSNSSDEEYIEKCYALHVNACIQKPRTIENFIQLLNLILKLWLDVITLPEIRGVEYYE